LAFNDSTLEAAEARTDLFTPKQCETIKKRKIEVEEILTQELDNAIEEAQKHEAQERERKMMETKAQQMKIPRRAPVKIQGLKNRPELNGTMGTYMGLAQGDRYTVRLDYDGKDIALKAANFTEWDFAKDGFPSATNRSTSSEGKEKEKRDPQSNANNPEPKPSACKKSVSATTKSSKPTTAPKNQENAPQSETKEAESKGPAQNHPVENHPDPLTNLRAVNRVQQPTPIVTSSPLDMRAVPPVNDASTLLGLQSNVGLEGFCILGLNCPALHQGPDVCPLVHKPEEIAFFHPHHLSPVTVSKPAVQPIASSPKEQAAIPVQVKHAKTIKRCHYGAKCFKLKRGPDKCNFFHPPEEIALHHPTFAGSPATDAVSRVKDPTPKQNKKASKACKYGSECHKLRRGPKLCPFYHSPEDISFHHADAGGTVPREGSESVSTNGSAAISMERRTANVERSIRSEANAGPHGKHDRRAKEIMKQVTPEVDSKGMSTVRIIGSRQAVNGASNEVVGSSLQPAPFADTAEECSILSNLTGDDPSLLTKSAGATVSSTTYPSGVSGAGGLKEFILQNKSCLKCSPDKFYQWLCSEDIETIESLAEACQDEDYHAVLQQNGLKGFKRGPFLKAVKAACASV